VYATYNELLTAGWTMPEIDGMDFPGFLRLRTWDARRKKETRAPKRRFIDEVWPEPG